MPEVRSAWLFPDIFSNPAISPATVAAWCSDPANNVKRIYLGATPAAFISTPWMTYYRDMKTALSAVGVQMFAQWGESTWADAGGNPTNAQYRKAAEYVRQALILRTNSGSSATRLFDGIMLLVRPSWLTNPLTSGMENYVIMWQQAVAESRMYHCSHDFPVAPPALPEMWLSLPTGLHAHTLRGLQFDRWLMVTGSGVEVTVAADTASAIQTGGAQSLTSARAISKPLTFALPANNLGADALDFSGETKTYMRSTMTSVYNNLTAANPQFKGSSIYTFQDFQVLPA